MLAPAFHAGLAMCSATGKDYWDDFEKVFSGISFTDLEPGRVRVAQANDRAIVLTHFLSTWFETEQRVDSIAEHLEVSLKALDRGSGVNPAAMSTAVMAPADKPATAPNQHFASRTALSAPA